MDLKVLRWTGQVKLKSEERLIQTVHDSDVEERSVRCRFCLKQVNTVKNTYKASSMSSEDARARFDTRKTQQLNRERYESWFEYIVTAEQAIDSDR